MKKLLLASLAVLAISAQAAPGTTTTGFNVTATIDPSCVAGVAPIAPVVAFGAYPAFSSGAIASTTGFTATVNCTRFLASAPTAAFDVGTDKLATGQGIVAGLNYSLTATAVVGVGYGSGSGAEPTATTGAHNGTPDKYGFTVSGSLPSGQAGSTAAPVSDARSLIISF